jgi:hypothetical protein
MQLRILIAILGGAAVGLERPWSPHASGPKAHSAGISDVYDARSDSGLGRMVVVRGLIVFASVLASGAAALIAAAYDQLRIQHVHAIGGPSNFRLLRACHWTTTTDSGRGVIVMLSPDS